MAADAVKLTQGLIRRIQQVDHIRGDDRVKALIGVGKVHDIPPLKVHVGVLSVFLLRAAEHVGGEVSGNEAFAPGRYHAAEKPRAAGAFKHRVRRGNEPRHRGAELFIRLFIDDVRKDVVHKRNVIPKHRFPPVYLSISGARAYAA